MKVTPELMKWMNAKMNERHMSWADVEKIAGKEVSRMTLYRALTGRVDEISARTESAICKVFGVTTDDLLAISEGRHNNGGTRLPPGAQDSLVLWQWIMYDPMRAAVLRALGFHGALPQH